MVIMVMGFVVGYLVLGVLRGGDPHMALWEIRPFFYLFGTYLLAMALIDDVGAVRPWLPGRLADEVAAAMDFVLYLYGQEDDDPSGERNYRRMFLTAPHKRVFAKDRSGTLPLWVNPTWEALTEPLRRTPSAAVAVAA